MLLAQLTLEGARRTIFSFFISVVVHAACKHLHSSSDEYDLVADHEIII